MSADAARKARNARAHPTELALISLGFFILSIVAVLALSSPASAQPAVTLSSPAGGEDWTGGSVHTIVWSVSDFSLNDTYWLNESVDNGASWSPIVTGIVVANGATRTTNWSVPLVATSVMRVSLCAWRNFIGSNCTTSGPFQVDTAHPIGTPNPASGLTGVDPRSVLYLDFNEVMKNQTLPLTAVTFAPAVSVTSLTWITPTLITPVGARELAITHADFAPATMYFWYVDCSIVDASIPGNPVLGCGSPQWSFRSDTPPSVLSLTVDGASAPNETLTVPSDWVPTFSWTFQDPDAGSAQAAYEWDLVYRDNSTVVSSSGVQYTALSTAVYSGPKLIPGLCYSLHVRAYDGIAWSVPVSLDFCVVLETIGPIPASVLSLIALGSFPIVILAAFVVLIRPQYHGVGTAVGVLEALLALGIDIPLIIVSIAPLRFALSPGPLLAAFLIVLPLVVHFLPESSPAALDPSPEGKVWTDLASAAAVAATAFVFPGLLIPVAIASAAADASLASSSGARLGSRRVSTGAALGRAPPASSPTPVGEHPPPPSAESGVAGPPPPAPVGGHRAHPGGEPPGQVGEGLARPSGEVGVEHEDWSTRARPTLREPGGRERKAQHPRYVNVFFTPSGSSQALDRRLSLAPGRRYSLRIDIGPTSLFSVVVKPEEHPVPEALLPLRRAGHWLQVAVLSNQFKVAPRLHMLFLPPEGPAWVCACSPSRPHTCTEDTRQRYLNVEVATPEGRGLARLRISIYFENNLVQSQLLTAEIADREAEGVGQRSEVDYTLTAQLQDVGFLSSRSLNILTNRNSDGTHSIVFKNGTDEALAFTIPERALQTAIDTARGTLLDIHRQVYGGQLGSKRQIENLYDENNSKDKIHFVADLKKLAQVGWDLWCSIFQPADHEAKRHLLEFIRESGKTIQVARVETTSFVFPWAFVYDIPIDGEADSWRLCKVLDRWDSPGSADELPSTCPFEETHTENMICPYGFWGMRHIIEEPPSSHDANLPVSISVHSPASAVMSSSLDLDPMLASRHLQALAGLVPGFDLAKADSRDELRNRLGASVLGLVYFYCHGKREESPGAAAPRPYLEIGHEEKVRPSDITAWQVEGWTDPNHWSTTPLVFINGCHTTELSPELLVNFVDAFRGANAGGVIGTEISIDQRVANEAAERFFHHFVNQEPVGRALLLVRLGLLRKGNLLGLAYTAYCSANLRFTYT